MSGPALPTPVPPVIGQADRKGRDSPEAGAPFTFFSFLIALKAPFLPAVAAGGKREVQVRFPRLVFGGLPTRLPPPPTHRLQLKQLKKVYAIKAAASFLPLLSDPRPLLQLTARGGRRAQVPVAPKPPGSAAPRQDRGLERPPRQPAPGFSRFIQDRPRSGRRWAGWGDHPKCWPQAPGGTRPAPPLHGRGAAGSGAQGLAFS